MTDPADERGMILLNVLVIVAITSAVVVLMISTQDVSTARSLRMSEASRALSIAHGGELSAITALRRDLRDSPQSDHLREPWAAIGQAATPIEGGTFSLGVADAQSRFNVNNLKLGGAVAENALRDLCVVAQARKLDCDRLVNHLRLAGPLDDLDSLAEGSGVDPALVARLGPMITALPAVTSVNVNTAPEPLLAVILRNPASAHALVVRRQARGYLTDEDMRAANVFLTSGLSATSDFFWVETRVTIGETPQALRSLVRRRIEEGALVVEVVSRKRLPAAPLRDAAGDRDRDAGPS